MARHFRPLMGLLSLMLASCVLPTRVRADTIAFNDFGAGNSYSVSGLGIGGGSHLTQGGAFISTATGEVSEIVTGIVVGTSLPGSGYTLNLYADNSNFPGSLLGSFGGSAPAAPGTSDILTPSSGVLLTSGQKYWLIASSSNDLNWRQNNQSVIGPWYYHDGSGTTFVSSTTLVAFKVLVSNVPEPSSIALAVVAFAACLVVAARRAS